MNRIRRSLLLVFVVVLTIILAACGGDDKVDGDNGKDKDAEEIEKGGETEEPEVAVEQVLNINIKEEPPSLHPGKASDTTSSAVLDQIFEGLTRINQDGEIENAMAENIDISEDQTTYTFTIRDGVNWSNGDPVTAHDFEYAWKWVLDPESPDTDYAYQLYVIKNAEAAKEAGGSLDDVGITAEDDKTLVVVLEQPTPYFLDLTAFYTYYPLNKSAVEGNDDWALDVNANYITNGPFTLESWEHKDKIVLQKNADYWDADTVQLETLNMFMIEDESTELKMYESGELDWAGSPTGSIPLSAIPSLLDEGALNISSLAGVYYYAYNIEAEPFNNINIRKAFALAIDREGIVKSITKGEQQPAMALVPPSIWDENTVGYFLDNDVEQAKVYLKKGLEELGLDTLPTVNLSYNTNEAHASIAQAVQDMWRKNLDVDVELNNEEWGVYLDSMGEGDFQVGRMGWLADFNDAINFLEIYQTVGGNNYTNWEDKAYSDLLEASRVESDDVKRKGILREAEQIFMDALPISPVYFYTNVWLNKEYVKNIEVSPLGGVQFKWGYIDGSAE